MTHRTHTECKAERDRVLDLGMNWLQGACAAYVFGKFVIIGMVVLIAIVTTYWAWRARKVKRNWPKPSNLTNGNGPHRIGKGWIG